MLAAMLEHRHFSHDTTSILPWFDCQRCGDLEAEYADSLDYWYGRITENLVSESRSGCESASARGVFMEHLRGVFMKHLRRDCPCLRCRARRSALKPSKAERLEQTAAEMRERNLTTGSGCKTRLRAIEARLSNRRRKRSSTRTFTEPGQ